MLQTLRRFVALACVALLVGCSNGQAAPDFTLRDDSAHPWTLSQQRGKAVLLTFGFTHCADTCPATLAKLGHLTRTLGKRAGDVEIAFVTIDPKRDTAAVMHRFIARFVQPGESPLLGLTGTAPQIAAVENAYRVWSQRMPSQVRMTPGDYDEAHSTVIFLIDPQGRIHALRDADDSAKSITDAVSEMLV